MTDINQHNDPSKSMRVLRISHASLTPALRERERALVRRHPNVDLEVVTTERWREAEVDVEATDDDLFPVTKSRAAFEAYSVVRLRSAADHRGAAPASARSD